MVKNRKIYVNKDGINALKKSLSHDSSEKEFLIAIKY